VKRKTYLPTIIRMHSCAKIPRTGANAFDRDFQKQVESHARAIRTEAAPLDEAP